MQIVKSAWSGIFSIAPYPIRLLLNLVALPFVLAFWLPKIALAGWREGINQKYSVRDVRDRFLIEDVPPGSNGYDDALAQAADLSDAEDWDGLRQLVEGWEKSARQGTTTSRFYRAALIGSRHAQFQALSQEIDDCGPVGKAQIDTSTFDRLATAQAARPEDPVLAAITARAAIEIGWALRGGGYIEETSQAALDAMTAYFDQAAHIVAPFDIETCTSATLLLVQHMLADGMVDADKHLRKSYEAWRKSAPNDLMLYGDHAFKLLPRWFGDYQELEVTARKAAAEALGALGSGAYAAFYLGVLDRDDGTVFYVDKEFLEDSLQDLIRAFEGDQSLVNIILATLEGASTSYIGEDRRLAGSRQELRALFCRLTRQHLKRFDPDAWQMKPMEAKMCLAEAFAEELAAGKMIRFGDKGGVVRRARKT